jgi:hypothetical protein
MMLQAGAHDLAGSMTESVLATRVPPELTAVDHSMAR